MSNKQPYNNILITVAGSTPQIITETFFNLAVQKNIVINEIYALTTTHGQEEIQNNILDQNIIYKMLREYGKHERMPQFEIVLICDAHGAPLSDVRTLEDNLAAANRIINFVKNKTLDENTRLFCSLAGGRKTMSSYMAIALNLFGRKQDELSHVLIYPQEREKDKSFFYPKPDDTITRIDYARIPFIRLRDKLEKLFGDIDLIDYDLLVKLTKLDVNEIARDIKAGLDKKNRRLSIYWGETVYELSFEPKLFAIYRFLFERKKPQELTDNTKLQNLYRKDYGFGKDGKFDQDNIKKDVSGINHKVLEPRLPELLYELFRINMDKKAAKEQYFIPLHFSSRKLP